MFLLLNHVSTITFNSFKLFVLSIDYSFNYFPIFIIFHINNSYNRWNKYFIKTTINIPIIIFIFKIGIRTFFILITLNTRIFIALVYLEQ